MIVYNTVSRLATKTVDSLQGLLMTQLCVSQVEMKLATVTLIITAPSGNHNTWQKLTDRGRTWGDIDGLLVNVLEVSERSFTANNSNIKIIKPVKNYSATLKLIRAYNEEIKLLNKYNSNIKG